MLGDMFFFFFFITLDSTGKIDIVLEFDGSSDGPPLCIAQTLASFKTAGNTPVCRLIFIIYRRYGNKMSESRLSIFGQLIPSVPVDLIGSRDFNMDFSSSDLMSGTLKCIFSDFLELMNSFSTSALRSLKGRLSFISLSLTFAKYRFISSIIA